MNTFTVEYGNGFIELNVQNYFVKAGLPDIKKIFKFAKSHCNDDDRLNLIANLKQAKKFWQDEYRATKKGQRTVGVFWLNSDKPPNQSPVTKELLPHTDKQLSALQTKLNKVIEILQTEKWRKEFWA